MGRLAGWTLLLLGLALTLGGCARFNLFKRSAEPAALTAGPRVGSPAPDIDGADFTGKRFKLSDYRGKVVVVSFWATRCIPCLKLIPHEQALVQRYRDRNFVLLGVNLDENPEVASQVMTARGVSWRNWQAGTEGNPIQQLWPVDFIPALYVIDAKGIVRHARVSGDHIERAIEPLLAEVDAKR